MVTLSGDRIKGMIEKTAPIVGAGVGAVTFLQVATKSEGSFDFGAQINTLVNNVKTGNVFKPTVNTILNDKVWLGAGLLVTNFIIDAVIDGKFGYKYAEPIIQAVGAGFLGGGLVGGLVDPEGQSAMSANRETRTFSPSGHGANYGANAY